MQLFYDCNNNNMMYYNKNNIMYINNIIIIIIILLCNCFHIYLSMSHEITGSRVYIDYIGRWYTHDRFLVQDITCND